MCETSFHTFPKRRYDAHHLQEVCFLLQELIAVESTYPALSSSFIAMQVTKAQAVRTCECAFESIVLVKYVLKAWKFCEKNAKQDDLCSLLEICASQSKTPTLHLGANM